MNIIKKWKQTNRGEERIKAKLTGTDQTGTVLSLKGNLRSVNISFPT